MAETKRRVDFMKSLNNFVEIAKHLQMNNVTTRKKLLKLNFTVCVKTAPRPCFMLTELKMFSQLLFQKDLVA